MEESGGVTYWGNWSLGGEPLVLLGVDTHGPQDTARMADNRLLLPLPVLPQTPSMVPCKAKEDRPTLGQVTHPGWVYCLNTK